MLMAPTITERDDPVLCDTHDSEECATFLRRPVIPLARFLSASLTGMISWREYQCGKKILTSTHEISDDQDD